MKADNSTKEGNFKETDTVQSTDWSLRCLSHRKNRFTFELVNLKTRRAHKLIFSAAGTDEVTETDVWTDGFYPIPFKTEFPATFDNFDDTFAMLTPKTGGKQWTHLLRIGWLAKVEVHQQFGEGFGAWHLYGNCKIEYGSGEAVQSSKIYGTPGWLSGGAVWDY